MDLDELHERIGAMSENERLALDPIARALDAYLRRDHESGAFPIPNRIVALACADLARQWQQKILEQE
jgi:hypothetical protein